MSVHTLRIEGLFLSISFNLIPSSSEDFDFPSVGDGAKLLVNKITRPK